jgi:ribosomal protein S18 acetylase RimI-like enzyme
VTSIAILGPGDEHVFERVAPDVFDRLVRPALAAEFLEDPRHHIAVATDEGRVVGFASGVTYLHPDKPLELWINEVGVASSYRREGLGARLLAAMLDRGRALGCREAWLLTERTNDAALRLYRAVGGAESRSDDVVVSFDLGRSSDDLPATPESV